MSERLRSVGLDVGTTSTQLILSELTVENRASGFAVPEMEISQRRILYKGAVHFTPLLDESHVDGPALRRIVDAEYQKAGISRDMVDTGAVIITGETSRKENARAVLEALSDLAGEFVVATAGPDLESVLAAKGAGAVDESRETGKTLLHMDIGGGTSNLALIREGKILQTGCLNVGGRLLKFGERGELRYVSPVLAPICDLQPGQIPSREQLAELAGLLTGALEAAAGKGGNPAVFRQLITEGTEWEPPEEDVVLSFSGGVADCIARDFPWEEFGDIGPALGQTIRNSALCRGEYRLGEEPIRATVIGAGCHSTQLSGSTVYHQNIPFPLKDVPVVQSLEELRIWAQEGQVVLALPGIGSPTYAEVSALAEKILAVRWDPLLICLEQDMAKALGQALALRLPRDAGVLCIDRVRIPPGSYLDVGAPVGCALPVVVKTLVLGK